jgi:phosphatidylglycerol:prolipoprotein diacylglycerol transferase
MFPTFDLLGKTIPTYALMSLIGIFVSGIYICKKAKQKGYDENNFIIILLLSSIGVFFGGHILYSITRFDLIIKLFSNWNTYVHSFGDFIECAKLICGGSVFYGGLIGGMIVGFTVHNNQLLPSVNDVQRFPVQLLESLLNLILFFILAYLLKKELLKGKLFATYLLSYSVIRFFDEFLRGDTYRGFLLGLSTSQIISIVIFICSIIYLIYQGKKNNTHSKYPPA